MKQLLAEARKPLVIKNEAQAKIYRKALILKIAAQVVLLLGLLSLNFL